MRYPPEIAESRSRLFSAVWRGIVVSLLAGALAGGLLFWCLWLVRRAPVLPQLGAGGVNAATGTHPDTPLAAALGMMILVFASVVRSVVRPAWSAFDDAGGRQWMSRSNTLGFDELCKHGLFTRYNSMLGICAVLAMLGSWSTLHTRVEFTARGVAHFKPLHTTRFSYAEVAAVWWIPEGYKSLQLDVKGPAFVIETVAGERVRVNPDGFAGTDVKPLAEHVASLSHRTTAQPSDLAPR